MKQHLELERQLVLDEINKLHYLGSKTDFDRSIRKSVYHILANRIGRKKWEFGKFTKDELRDIFCIVKYRRTFKEIQDNKKSL